MSRRGIVPKREILPDPKYGSVTLSRFINVVVISGKKSLAEKLVYGALAIICERLSLQKKGDDDSGGDGSNQLQRTLEVFEKILQNVRPTVEVRSRRVGGATYQIPIEVKPNRSVALAMRWLVQYSRARGEKGMMRRLAGEMLDAYEGRGAAVKKREDTHRMAKANQAFAHFRWN